MNGDESWKVWADDVARYLAEEREAVGEAIDFATAEARRRRLSSARRLFRPLIRLRWRVRDWFWSGWRAGSEVVDPRPPGAGDAPEEVAQGRMIPWPALTRGRSGLFLLAIGRNEV